VTSVHGNEILIKDFDGFTRTIKTSSKTTYRDGLTANPAVGTQIVAAGSVDCGRYVTRRHLDRQGLRVRAWRARWLLASRSWSGIWPAAAVWIGAKRRAVSAALGRSVGALRWFVGPVERFVGLVRAV
jgi:hypothetical protein